jgi:hypothetical protein
LVDSNILKIFHSKRENITQHNKCRAWQGGGGGHRGSRDGMARENPLFRTSSLPPVPPLTHTTSRVRGAGYWEDNMVGKEDELDRSGEKEEG